MPGRSRPRRLQIAPHNSVASTSALSSCAGDRLRRWFDRDEVNAWRHNTWDFAKLLVPLLFGGVFVVGFIGSLLPDEQVAALVGDNSFSSNLAASLVGCLFYFATLTEIPILQALMEHGMHEGPALALLLAGPALSLPSLLVIRSVLGVKKTAVFATLVVVMATVVGMTYGTFVQSAIRLGVVALEAHHEDRSTGARMSELLGARGRREGLCRQAGH